MNRQIFLIIVLVFGVFSFFVSCEKSTEEGNIDGKLTSFTDCKEFKNFYATDSVSNNMSCVDYAFSNSVLSLSHVNAGFNCCPVTIGADIIFNENTITVSEYETSNDCDCNCLYDLEIEITNIELGMYDFIFVEPYINILGEELIFTINLADSAQGSFCVERLNYPWGI